MGLFGCVALLIYALVLDFGELAGWLTEPNGTGFDEELRKGGFGYWVGVFWHCFDLLLEIDCVIVMAT